MRIETLPDGSKHFIAEPGEHLVYTGPVQGLKTLADGTTVDVTQDYVAVGSIEAAHEVSDLIGAHWVALGHPNDVDTIAHPETGQPVLVQRPFVHVPFNGPTVTGVGHPVGTHPVEVLAASLANTSAPTPESVV